MNASRYAIYTVILLLVFVSIAMWVFSKKHKARFNKDTNIPFEEAQDWFPDQRHNSWPKKVSSLAKSSKP